MAVTVGPGKVRNKLLKIIIFPSHIMEPGPLGSMALLPLGLAAH